MKTLHLSYGCDLFGQHVVTIYHDALEVPMQISREHPEEIRSEAERLLVIITKTLLGKFLTVARKSRAAYMSYEVSRVLEDLDSVKRYVTRRMHLATVQDKLQLYLDKMATALPRERSRTYPSQLAKYRFFQAVVAFDLSQVERLITSTAETRL